MGITELRQVGGIHADVEATLEDVQEKRAADLVRYGAISPEDISHARTVQRNCNASLDRILLTEGLASRQSLLDVHAKSGKTRRLSADELRRLPYRRADRP